jgi:isopenicillin N synthase-like dioxygenase
MNDCTAFVCRDLLHEYASKTKKVRDNVLRAMGKILELGEDYFISQIGEKSPAIARFNYYPPCPRPELVFGIKPHSDGGAVTILLVDNDVGGLQVQKDGIWYTVPSKPHTLVINLGDSMEVGILDSVLLLLTETERDYDYAYASS